MTDSAIEVQQKAALVFAAGERLRAASMKERASWIAEAARTLRHAVALNRGALSEATGLSVPMVDWAARTTLDTIHEDALLRLAKDAYSHSSQTPEPIAMLSLLLAGNVFTAPVKGIVAPLLLGVPVLVKTSSVEAVFPGMLEEALRSVDGALAEAIGLVGFKGGDRECERALIDKADAVSIYGSDETVASMGERLHDATLIEHGHGVSVAYCGAESLDEGRLDATLRALALDICAYDQRGCLSPQLAYVEATPNLTASDFAGRLARALDALGVRLPRGPLPASVGAEQAQWRGVAEVEGSLIRGEGYALSVRPARPIRWSPAYRNVTIAPVRGVDEAVSCMAPIGSNLKCIGADPRSLEDLDRGIGRNPAFRSYTCPLGTMQTPSLDAPADGRPIWYGLLRPSGDS